MELEQNHRGGNIKAKELTGQREAGEVGAKNKKKNKITFKTRYEVTRLWKGLFCLGHDEKSSVPLPDGAHTESS